MMEIDRCIIVQLHLQSAGWFGNVGCYKREKKNVKKMQVSHCVACCLLIGIIVQTQDCDLHACRRVDVRVCDCVAVLSIYYCIIRRHQYYALVKFMFVEVRVELGQMKM